MCVIINELKEELSKLKYKRRMLPLYIDCSKVYGDNTYTYLDIIHVDNRIEYIKNKLKQLGVDDD